MLTRTQDNEEIIQQVAALDIGKAELMCCARVPDEGHPGKRLQEVAAYSTRTRSLLGMAGRLAVGHAHSGTPCSCSRPRAPGVRTIKTFGAQVARITVIR